MLNILNKLPKLLIAILAIVIGIAYIISTDPPKTFCGDQSEHFRSVNKGILFKDPKEKIYKKSLITRSKERCRELNSPGACYSYFFQLRKFLKNFYLVSNECLEQVSKIKEVKTTLIEGIIMMTLLAFREETLENKLNKLNWLSFSDLNLFCKLKSKYNFFFGKEELIKLEKFTLLQVPNEKKISIDEIKRKTLFSESCTRYLKNPL